METKYTPGPWHKELGGFVYSDHSKVADAGFAKKECERSANALNYASATGRVMLKTALRNTEDI